MLVGGNSYSGGEMDLGSGMQGRWNGLWDGGIHVERNSLGDGTMHSGGNTVYGSFGGRLHVGGNSSLGGE